MKLLYTTSTILLAIFLLNNAAGPGTVQNEDRTGSPLSSGTCAIAGCHSGTSFSPSIAVQLLKSGTAVTVYEPGESYTLKVTTTAGSGTPSRYGFQTVALTGTDNVAAGVFGSAPSGFKKVTLANRTYVEHSSPRTNNSFEIEWTAPAAGAGDVRFHAAGIAANANGSTNGDGTASLTSPLTISEMTVGLLSPQALLEGFAVMPNPVGEMLTYKADCEQSGNYTLRLTTLNGQIMQQQRVSLVAGENIQTIDISELPGGVYTLSITDGERLSATRVVKL